MVQVIQPYIDVDDVHGAAPLKHSANHAIDGVDPVTPESIGAASVVHASAHASSGSDPVTPDSIGAAAVNHTHADKADLVDGKVPLGQLPSELSGGFDPVTLESIGAASVVHASAHAVGGSDPVTPESIGAAAVNHTHADKADLVDGKVPLGQLPSVSFGEFISYYALNADGVNDYPSQAVVLSNPSVDQVNIADGDVLFDDERIVHSDNHAVFKLHCKCIFDSAIMRRKFVVDVADHNGGVAYYDFIRRNGEVFRVDNACGRYFVICDEFNNPFVSYVRHCDSNLGALASFEMSYWFKLL